MSNPGPGSKSFFVRLAIILILGGGVILYFKLRGSPLALTEQQAARILDRNELVGLPLDEACKRLQHKPTDTTDGTVELDFPGWSNGGIVLDVRAGKVASAVWKKDAIPADGDQ